MTEKNIKRIHLLYGLVLSCLLLITGACLITACLSIYGSGDRPFSRESVALAFGRISIPVYLCLGGIVGGMILSLVLPLPTSKKQARLDRRDTLKRLLGRLEEEALEPEAQKRLADERALRKTLRTICIAISVLCAATAAIYVCNPSNYTLENLNGDILTAAIVTVGFFALAFAVCFACTALSHSSVARELEAVKEALKTAPRKDAAKPSAKAPSPRLVWAIRGAILLVGVLFLLLGIFNGGAEDVLGKAIRICTECIGLG